MGNPVQDLQDSVERKLVDLVVERLGQVGAELLQQKLDDVNAKLAEAQAGKKLFESLPVIAADAETLTLQVRGKTRLGKIPTSVFYRAHVTVGRKVSLGAGVPRIDLRALPSLMADAEVTVPRVGVGAIGFGWDGWEAGFPLNIVGRGTLEAPTLGMRLELFLGGFSENGFVVGVSTPLIVPLGGTGLALSSLGGTIAVNMEPRLDASGISRVEKPTAADYVSWAQRAAERELDAWQPATEGYHVEAGGFGITASVVTLADGGYLLALRDAGFAILLPGPVALIGGTGVVLSQPNAKVRVDAAISLRDLSIAFMGSASLLVGEQIGDWVIAEVSGGSNGFFSFSNPSAWYLNHGTRKKPLRGAVINRKYSGVGVYVMLNAKRAVVGGGLVRRFGPLKFLKVTARALMELEGKALVGWNPVQVAIGLAVRGELSLAIWKVKAGFELWLDVVGKIPAPVSVLAKAGATIAMPWPANDIEWEAKIIDWQRATPPELAGPLRSSTLELTLDPEGAPLGALHPVSGRQWELDASREETLWPDVELVVPFSRRARDRTSSPRVMGPPVGAVREGGFVVEHDLELLRIMQVNDAGPGPAETEVPNIRAVWAAGPGGTSTRLHVNAEDPFAWLTPFSSALAAASETTEDLVEQSFLPGPAATLGDGTMQRFGRIGVLVQGSARRPPQLLRPPADHLGTRLLATCAATFSFFESSGPEPTYVDSVRVILVGERGTVLLAPGRVRTTPLRSLHGDLWLLSAELPVSTRVHTINVACARPRDELLLLYRVLFRPKAATAKWSRRTVLQPGRYRLELKGRSRIRGESGSEVSWTRQQPFRIAIPETLRPYVRDSTVGDSRIFGQEVGMWNPTPHGQGFPTYSSYVGVIRFRVPHVAAVFGEGWEVRVRSAGPGADRLDRTLRPVPNVLGETTASARSTQWIQAAGEGASPVPDGEFAIPPGWERGPGTLHLGLFPTMRPEAASEPLDEWGFEGSRFASFTEHVAWSGTRPRLQIGPNGATDVPAGAATAGNLAMNGATVAQWALGATLGSLVHPPSLRSSVDYLSFFDAAGVSVGTAGARLAELSAPVAATSIDVLVGQDGRPLCLWVRTPEPIDWRRVSVTLRLDRNHRQIVNLSGEVLPSPDATSALVVALANATPIRMPRGTYTVGLTYRMTVPGLPRLRRADAVQGRSADEAASWKLELPLGA